MSENYYYRQMAAPEQQVYRMICEGLHRHQRDIKIPAFPGMMKASEIYYKVLYDRPFFFYVKQNMIGSSQQKGEYILHPQYIYSADQVRNMVDEMHQVVDKVVHKALMYKDDPFKMELFLHNSVVKSVAYDYESLKMEKNDSAHSIVGPFLENKAVCEGTAKAFQMLCELVGLPCIFVVGHADGKGQFDKRTLHAWNLVKMGGQWYHVDPTWDAFDRRRHKKGPVNAHIGFDYFNLTTEDIAVDHRAIEHIPPCISQEYNYFYYMNKVAGTYEDIVRMIDQQYESDRIRLRIDQKASAFLNGNTKEQTLQALQEVIYQRKKADQFTYYFNERLGTVNLCRK